VKNKSIKTSSLHLNMRYFWQWEWLIL